MVATRDIGMKAADFLDRLDFQGHQVFELFGPRPIKLTEVATLLGNRMGQPF